MYNTMACFATCLSIKVIVDETKMEPAVAYEADGEQQQCSSSSSPGIPQMIDTTTKNEHKIEVSLDSLHIIDDPTSFKKTNNNESLSLNDDHTADETCLESPGSSINHNHTNTNLEYDDDDANEEVSSTESEEIIEEGPDFSDDEETIDSTRMLLKQAQERSEYQSVYEEVKLLRAEVSQCRQSIQVTLSQKLELKSKCNSLKNQLTQAQEHIQAYKVKELQWYEDGAEREKEYMNQLDEMCSSAKAKEEELMAELVERDMRIIEMQNMLNENDLKRINAMREENMNESDNEEEETEMRKEEDVHDSDEDASDAESCSFI